MSTRISSVSTGTVSCPFGYLDLHINEEEQRRLEASAEKLKSLIKEVL